jgi:drug/metabolite transporter (DMT)-like permease
MLVTLLMPPIAISLGVAFLDEKLAYEAWLGFGLNAIDFVITDGSLLGQLRNKWNR